MCFSRWLRKTIYIKAENVVEFTDDIHILVNGAIDEPEVSFLFFSLECLFLERNLTLCLVSFSFGADCHKNFIRVTMKY